MNEMQRFAPFVGRWHTRGRVHGEDRTISGTDTYEWLAGGHFLVHHVDVRMGDEEIKSIEIIGWDAGRGTFLMHSFDSQGQHTVMRASVDDGTWRFEGETMRFTGAFGDGGRTIAGTWELREGGWRPWMDVELTKAVPFRGDDPSPTTDNR